MYQYQYQFTVFTPIYNRKHTIHRVWESLISQTYKNFEWIVVNDGSNDGIETILDEYKSAACFPVMVIHQSNQGKHIAWNKAVDIAKGEIFVPADSDDAFEPESLECFLNHWMSIPIKDRKNFSGINVLCKDSETQLIIGNQFPKSPFVSSNLDLVYKYKIYGEKWGCVKTECLRLRKFPDIRADFFPESWIWFWLSKRFKVLCINIPLRTYYQNEGDNISKKKTKEYHVKRLQSNYAFLNWHVSENIDYIKLNGLTYIFKIFMNLWRESFYLKLSSFSLIKNLKSLQTKFFAIITFFPGFCYYLFSVYKDK